MVLRVVSFEGSQPLTPPRHLALAEDVPADGGRATCSNGAQMSQVAVDRAACVQRPSLSDAAISPSTAAGGGGRERKGGLVHCSLHCHHRRAALSFPPARPCCKRASSASASERVWEWSGRPRRARADTGAASTRDCIRRDVPGVYSCTVYTDTATRVHVHVLTHVLTLSNSSKDCRIIFEKVYTAVCYNSTLR